MSDPSANDPLLRALAYLHPAWMLVSIALAGLAARSGLRMRRARRLGARRERGERGRHLRLGKLAITLVAIGAVGGPASMLWLRGRSPFETAHGWIGLVALALFVAAAALGRRLEHGRGRPLDAHAALALLALLLSGVAALAGFVLLP